MNWYYGAKAGLDIRGFWKSMANIIAPVLLFLILCGAAYWLLPIPHGTWFSFIVAGVVYVIAYVAVLRALAMNDYEKGLLASVFRKARLTKCRD